ncbi:RNA-directed DNA polymerase, eukaryota [Tanacetum coccineum]
MGLITIQRKMSQVRYAHVALKSQRSERGGSMNFMSLNIQCLAQKAKKDWVKELCVKHKVNFLALQETKIEHMELFSLKMCWGNLDFDFVHSDSVVWRITGKDLLIIAVYAPHDNKDK